MVPLNRFLIYTGAVSRTVIDRNPSENLVFVIVFQLFGSKKAINPHFMGFKQL